MNLIFDLDGTLIDSSRRLYSLFQLLVPSSDLTYESYWALKRKKISNETILSKFFGFDSFAVERFASAWMARIESPEMLGFDTDFPGIKETLTRLQKRACLYVCTARQYQELAVKQIDRLGLLPYFYDIMVTQQRKSKKELIASISGLGSQDWIIGDTGQDIQAGKALGIKTCAVLGGFRGLECIRHYDPDLILPTANDFYV